MTQVHRRPFQKPSLAPQTLRAVDSGAGIGVISPTSSASTASPHNFWGRRPYYASPSGLPNVQALRAQANLPPGLNVFSPVGPPGGGNPNGSTRDPTSRHYVPPDHSWIKSPQHGGVHGSPQGNSAEATRNAMRDLNAATEAASRTAASMASTNRDPWRGPHPSQFPHAFGSYPSWGSMNAFAPGSMNFGPAGPMPQGYGGASAPWGSGRAVTQVPLTPLSDQGSAAHLQTARSQVEAALSAAAAASAAASAAAAAVAAASGVPGSQPAPPPPATPSATAERLSRQSSMVGSVSGSVASGTRKGKGGGASTAEGREGAGGGGEPMVSMPASELKKLRDEIAQLRAAGTAPGGGGGGGGSFVQYGGNPWGWPNGGSGGSSIVPPSHPGMYHSARPSPFVIPSPSKRSAGMPSTSGPSSAQSPWSVFGM